MSEKINHIKLTRNYGKDPKTNKPYPIGSVLGIGKEITEQEAERILRLGAGEPYQIQKGLMQVSDHDRIVKSMKDKAQTYQQQFIESKELLKKVLQKVDVTPVNVPELKQIATLFGLSGLGSATKDALIAEIEKTIAEESE